MIGILKLLSKIEAECLNEIMNKIIALIATSFALSACVAMPTDTETAQETPSDGADTAPGTQDTNTESGLGTVAYDERSRRKQCDRRRRTGSHLYTDSCSDPDGGSRPVREGDWNSLGRYVVTGSGRPNH